MSTAPIDIVPPEEEGPAAPNAAIDPILASLPPAVATPATPAPDETAWPPPVPAEALASQAPAAPPTAEGVARAQGGIDQQKAQIEADRAAKAADLAVQRQADMQEAIDKGDELLADRRKRYDEALTRYEGKKPHDIWADQPFGAKLAAIGGIMLGQLAGGVRGDGRNHALELLQTMMDRQERAQKEQIDQARDSVVMAKTGLQDAQAARSALVQEVYAKHAATTASIEADMRRRLADANVPAAAIDTDARIVGLQQQQAVLKQKAEQERQKEALQEAQRKYLEARANREQGKARKGGGGGGGGGQALKTFTDAALDGKTSPGDLAVLGRAAGFKPNQVAAEVTRIRQEQTKGPTGEGGIGAKRLEIRELGQWQQREGIPALIKSHDTLTGLNQKLADPNVDPATVALGLMEFDKAAKGGTATQGSFDTLMSHLGGLGAKLEGWVQHGYDGGLGKEQMATVRKAVAAALKESNERGAEKAASFDDKFGTEAPTAGDYNSIFRRFGKTRGGAAKLTAKDQAAIDWANANPNDPRAKEIKRLHGL